MTGARVTAVERTCDCPWNLFSELRRQVSRKGLFLDPWTASTRMLPEFLFIKSRPELQQYYEAVTTIVPAVQHLVAPNRYGKGFHLDRLLSNSCKN